MFLLPSYKHLTSAYTKSADPHNSPQPDNRRGPELISQPQNTTEAKYFHLSFTHRILQPPRSNTTNTIHIDRFKRALHQVSNIEFQQLSKRRNKLLPIYHELYRVIIFSEDLHIKHQYRRHQWLIFCISQEEITERKISLYNSKHWQHPTAYVLQTAGNRKKT